MTEFCPECHLEVPKGRGKHVDRYIYVVAYHRTCLLRKLENDPALPSVLRQLRVLDSQPELPPAA